MKSPLTITYNDLITWVSNKLHWMEGNLPTKVLRGEITAYTADRDLACAKQLLKMLKKHKKDPQLNLQDIFEKLK